MQPKLTMKFRSYLTAVGMLLIIAIAKPAESQEGSSMQNWFPDGGMFKSLFAWASQLMARASDGGTCPADTTCPLSTSYRCGEDSHCRPDEKCCTDIFNARRCCQPKY